MVGKEEIKAFYDSYKAGGYGRHTSRYEQEGRLLAILSLIDLKEVGLTLDVGCGVGWLTRQYAKLTQGQVIGIDFSKESINGARSKAIEEGLNNLKFEVMDAEELRFENNTFDCIICSEVLEHLLNPQKALDEMNRVVKPTGQIVITTPNPWNWNMVIGAFSRKLRRIPRRGQLYDQPMTPLKFNKMVKAAGMRIVRRKGTYYLPPLISPQRKLYQLFVKVSKFIERKNLLPYLGLYQVCLHRSSKYLSSNFQARIS